MIPSFVYMLICHYFSCQLESPGFAEDRLGLLMDRVRLDPWKMPSSILCKALYLLFLQHPPQESPPSVCVNVLLLCCHCNLYLYHSHHPLNRYSLSPLRCQALFEVLRIQQKNSPLDLHSCVGRQNINIMSKFDGALEVISAIREEKSKTK